MNAMMQERTKPAKAIHTITKNTTDKQKELKFSTYYIVVVVVVVVPFVAQVTVDRNFLR